MFFCEEQKNSCISFCQNYSNDFNSITGVEEFRQSTYLLLIYMYMIKRKVSLRRYFILHTVQNLSRTSKRSFNEKNILYMLIHRILDVFHYRHLSDSMKNCYGHATCFRRWYQAVAVKELSRIRVTNCGRKYSVMLLAEITTPTMIATANDRSFFISMCHIPRLVSIVLIFQA